MSEKIIENNLEATILQDVSLKPYNSLRLSSTARLMAYPHSLKGVTQIMERFQDDKEIIILGRGSNILLKQEYYDDSVLFLNLKMLDRKKLLAEEISIEAGATLSDLVWYGIENNIVGYEFMEDIPGTVGGAILMNAGTYRNYIGDLVTSVIYYDYDTRSIVKRPTTAEDFGRRKSFWTGKKTIILSCTLRAEKGDYLISLDEVQRVKKDRFIKQPRNFPSAGSVFVRPKVNLKDKVVWQLLDEVGLRGYIHNGAAFSKKHPGFIINLGNATYDDIKYLIDLAKEKVKNKFNVELTVEWKIV